jgi:hypothetical protein
MVRQSKMRELFKTVNRLVREKTAATAAAARRSAAGEALREQRLAWNARGVLADGEDTWAQRRPLAPMPKGYSKSISTMRSVRKLRGSAEARGAGRAGVLLGERQSVESEEMKTGAAALLAHEAPSAEPEPGLEHGALIGPELLLGDRKTVGSKAEPE